MMLKNNQFIGIAYILLCTNVFLYGCTRAEGDHINNPSDDDPDMSNVITLIQLSDLHGNLLPHAGEIINTDGTKRYVTQGGGLAKIKTLIDTIRADNPNSLLLNVGDTVHGTAEVMFTAGDAMMPAINALGIDAFTPGNWDFGYGAGVFLHQFSNIDPKPPLPANIKLLVDNVDGVGITAATFPSLAINLYYVSPPSPPELHHKRILSPYKMFSVNNTNVAVIGITSSIVPLMADVVNIGLRFTQGIKELPLIIEEVKAQNADVIVVISELGLPQNIEIGRRFKDVDVVFSAHTHEITLGALLADKFGVISTTPGVEISPAQRFRLYQGAAIVVETGEDYYLGRLDLEISSGKIIDFKWQALPVDDDVPEDPTLKALVDIAEEPFIKGKDGKVQQHSILPGGYCPDNVCLNPTLRGLQLVDDLDSIVGHTDVLLHRAHVLEDTVNNFIADAIREVTDPIVANDPVVANLTQWPGVDISMTVGFRFGNTILSTAEVGPGQTFIDGRTPGDITLRDLYSLFPLAVAVNVADYSGLIIERDLESVLTGVFNRNAFEQRGGWYMGLSNMTQKIDVINRPFSNAAGRIVETLIGGVPLDRGKRYVFASCYPHGDPVDRGCLTYGGQNYLFFELQQANDYSSPLTLVEPLNSESIIALPVIKQVAPDRFVHPVHILRRYLDTVVITDARHGTGRIQTVDSTVVGNPVVPRPTSVIDPNLVQPPEGAGPDFF